MKVTDRQIIDKKIISCDGGKGNLGHPKVFLTIDPKTNEVQCPYCSKLFVLENTNK